MNERDIPLAVLAVAAVAYLYIWLRPEFVVRCEPLPLHRRVKAHVMQRFRPKRR